MEHFSVSLRAFCHSVSFYIHSCATCCVSALYGRSVLDSLSKSYWQPVFPAGTERTWATLKKPATLLRYCTPKNENSHLKGQKYHKSRQYDSCIQYDSVQGLTLNSYKLLILNCHFWSLTALFSSVNIVQNQCNFIINIIIYMLL